MFGFLLNWPSSYLRGVNPESCVEILESRRWAEEISVQPTILEERVSSQTNMTRRKPNTKPTAGDTNFAVRGLEIDVRNTAKVVFNPDFHLVAMQVMQKKNSTNL